MYRAMRTGSALKTCLSNHVELFKLSPRCVLFRYNLGAPAPLVNACLCQITCRFKASSSRKGDKNTKNINALVQPVSVKPYNDLDGISVGEELAGSLRKDELTLLLNQFYRRPEIKRLAAESGLDDRLFHQAYVGFRRFCIESEHLPPDLHIIISDILQEAVCLSEKVNWALQYYVSAEVSKLGHVDDMFPYFLQHAKTMFPHLDCMDDLRKISDLRQPANWYPEARAIQRKIVYHSGPTNSGKTYHALERFTTAKSGVYCGPLRMLANEVFQKSNDLGTACDLVTGEERRVVDPAGEPSAHVACTVEMTNVTTPCEVAVIDEIQMIRDLQRGWAWTRAFLGVCAQEVHLCGEESAIELIRHLTMVTGDVLEIRKYKRLTNLKVLDRAIENFDRISAGDCIVCFSKNDIYTITRQLEKRGIEFAVIYGTLPPGTKLAQAQKFNKPDNSCKVMVATDAIGMGINLNIKRVVFYSLIKPFINEKGEKEMDIIQPSTALQIAGRAGRYASQFVEGEVTTFKADDLKLLKNLLNTDIEPIQQAGLHPTAEQIELFAYHLPKATLSNLIDIFVTLSQLDSDKYFMCNIDDFKFLADMIEHVPLQLRVRYVFCCAPIPKKQPFVCAMFLKFARQFSRGNALTLEWLCRQLGWPLQTPQTIVDLVHLEGVFDVLDLYLWLSYRFADMFPDVEHIRDMQKELDEIIQVGIVNITRLLRASETSVSSGVADDDEYDFEIRSKRGNECKLNEDVDADTLLPEKKKTDAKVRSRPTMSSRFQNAKATSRDDDTGGSTYRDFGSIRLKPGQRLTDQLLKKGLLTKDMIARIQQELSIAGSDDDDEDGSTTEKNK